MEYVVQGGQLKAIKRGPRDDKWESHRDLAVAWDRMGYMPIEKFWGFDVWRLSEDARQDRAQEYEFVLEIDVDGNANDVVWVRDLSEYFQVMQLVAPWSSLRRAAPKDQSMV